ncbi:hypothetical protein G4B88_020288 [Cannabis sativa]|uniref:Reverse transcriptase zinc-binding domain-containing protein n=1 Tax=Cannabis sativa TaxID=3483 RepID=A0A7J6GWG3_CANSA|nr:hypothetical protein G4B88_020288 [Cannabis sativa]
MDSLIVFSSIDECESQMGSNGLSSFFFFTPHLSYMVVPDYSFSSYWHFCIRVAGSAIHLFRASWSLSMAKFVIELWNVKYGIGFEIVGTFVTIYWVFFSMALWRLFARSNLGVLLQRDHLMQLKAICNHLFGVSLRPIAYATWYFKKLSKLRESIDKHAMMDAGSTCKFKVKLFHLSLVDNDRVSYHILISNRIVVLKHKCPVCDLGNESHSHLFFSCDFTGKVFAEITMWFGTYDWLESLIEVLIWERKLLKNSVDVLAISIMEVITYLVWCSKNR